MKSLSLVLLFAALSAGCGSGATGDPYYDLPDLAKASIAKDPTEAKELAEELLRLAATRQRDWNYGNAIHFGNMVL